VHSHQISTDELPQVFLTWLQDNGIDPRIYTECCHTLPRYIRLNPRVSETLAIAELATQLGAPLEPVPWLPAATSGGAWFRVDGSVKITGVDAYRRGQLYGMDASSAAAVLAMGCRPGDHILDLCCAPAAKVRAARQRACRAHLLGGVGLSSLCRSFA
jgi:16S rRNA C967 or C1407 C5-methylase (RsmB/RsmF family)